MQTSAHKIAYWLWLAVGVWAVFEFTRQAIGPVQETWMAGNFQTFITDGRIVHKIGELFLWVPFWIIVWKSTFQHRYLVALQISRTEYSMILGGFLNLIAWFILPKGTSWAWFCIVILIWGLAGGWFCRRFLLPRCPSGE